MCNGNGLIVPLNNNNYEMNEEDRKAVQYLRSQAADLLTEKYDTDFNLLRWVQGYGCALDVALENLIQHLKFRRYYDLDNADKIPEHEILHKYFPIGLVGETGVGNTLLVIESAGRIDLMGILKSVQLSDFLIQRARFQEKMLDSMNKLERKTGKQAAVIYILDLEGLKFDPALLQVVTGPYRILWASVYLNYPEWIDHMLIVNAPSFMTIIWKAIGPLLPERTRSKVKIFGTDKWKEALLELARDDCVPCHWGGTMFDRNGDPMCRDRLNIPFEPIPQSLYWKPDETAPAVKDLTAVCIPARRAKIFAYKVNHSPEEPLYFILNRYCDRTFGQGIWYSPDMSLANAALEELDEWCPDFDYPGMPTVDFLKIKVPGPGIYKLKFNNNQAWFRSLTLNFRMRFVNENDEDVDWTEVETDEEC